MSLNQLIEPVKRLDIIVGNIDCENITGNSLINELSFKTQNGDIVNLSSLPDKGTSGYRLTSDGDGSVSWVEGAGGSGVEYNGTIPVDIGKLAIYGGTDGNLIKNSTLSDTDILNKNGDIMLGNLDMNGKDILNCSIVKTSTISPNTNIDPNNLNILSDNVNFNAEFINCNGQPLKEIEWRFTRQGVNYGNFGTENGIFFFGNFNNPSVNTEIRGANNEKLVIDDGILVPECRLENLNFNMNNNNIIGVNNIKTLEITSNGGIAVNFKDDIDMGQYEINNCNEIRVSTISSAFTPDINMLNNAIGLMRG